MKYYKIVLLFLVLIPLGAKAQIEVCKYPGCGKFIAKSKNEKGSRFCPYQGKHPASVPMKVSKPVDLGLPSGTMWAEWNIGASAPEQKGFYYAWGETEPKGVYSWDTYFDVATKKRVDGDDVVTFREFEGNGYRQSIVGSTHDVAHVKWGKDWLIPSEEQWQELIRCCEIKNEIIRGVKGNRFTGKNGNSIFIPAKGFMHFKTLNDSDELFYWTGEIDGNYFAISASDGWWGGEMTTGDNFRRRGMQVRAVWNSSTAESLRTPGFLSISSNPTDCAVLIDGINIGRTPLKTCKVPSGMHTINVIKDGYRLFLKEVDIKKDTVMKESISMQSLNEIIGGVKMSKLGGKYYIFDDVKGHDWHAVMGGKDISRPQEKQYGTIDEIRTFLASLEKKTNKKGEILLWELFEPIKYGDVVKLTVYTTPLLQIFLMKDYEMWQDVLYVDRPYSFTALLEVDKDGCIDCPVLGKCHVNGLKGNDCDKMITEKYQSFLKQRGEVNYHFQNLSVFVHSSTPTDGMGLKIDAARTPFSVRMY